MKAMRIRLGGFLWLLVCCLATSAVETAETQEMRSPAANTDEAKVHAYCVDQSNPVAADTNPGTPDRPWKTIQHAADLTKPGDTVYVMTGQYEERVQAHSHCLPK